MQAHGGNIYKISKEQKIKPEKIIDFSSNINPLGPSPRVIKAIKKNLINLKNYPEPECKDLIEKLAAYNSVRAEQIILGNGAIELIYSYAQIIKPIRVLIVAPTFSEYASAFVKAGAKINYFELKEQDNFKMDIESLKKEIQNRCDLIILCNPDNPTSTFLKAEQLLEIVIAAQREGCRVMIDESFIEFVKGGLSDSIIQKGRDCENLIILRSMTKFFAIPGLRLGYLISFDSEIYKKIQATQYPWKINYLAALAGTVSLTDEAYIKKSIAQINKEREFFYTQLKKIEWLKVFTPEANFILLKILNDYCANDIYQQLLKKKILIRQAANFKFLNDMFFRVAVKKRSFNKYLLKCLAKL